MRSRRWGGTLPGVARLAQDLDVSRHTLRTALRQLETEGVLAGRGLGRSRGITAAGANIATQRPLCVAILRHDARLTDNTQTSAVLTEIMHLLEASGHAVFFCNKSQIELRNEVRRMTSELEKKPADAWIVEAARYIAAAEFLARRGIKVPEQVSLVSTDDDPSLAWCHPPIARMCWDPKPVIRRVVRWVDTVRKGKADREIINFPAEFITGGSIGPAWGARQEEQAEPEAPGTVPAPADYPKNRVESLWLIVDSSD